MKLVKDFIKDIMSVLLETIQKILNIPMIKRSELKYILDMHKNNGLFIGVIKECDIK